MLQKITLTEEQREYIIAEIGADPAGFKTQAELAELLLHGNLNGSETKAVSELLLEYLHEQNVNAKLSEIYDNSNRKNTTSKFCRAVRTILLGEEDMNFGNLIDKSKEAGEKIIGKFFGSGKKNTPEEEIHEETFACDRDGIRTLLISELGNAQNMTECWNVQDKIEYIPGCDFRFEDNFVVYDIGDKGVSLKLAAIVNNENYVVSLGKLEPGNDGYHYVGIGMFETSSWGNSAKMKLVLFGSKTADEIISGSEVRDREIYFIECSISQCRMKKAPGPLCVDFGTCNTTVGTYDENGSIMTGKFNNTLVVPNEMSDVLPTIVYVKDCSDSNNISYLFGYDAERMARRGSSYKPFEGNASVFYEIKRWVSTESEEISISDEEQHEAVIKKYDVISAYLRYVVEQAEHYFKREFDVLHFSAPAKLMAKTNDLVARVFKDSGKRIYTDGKDSIDEGIAIVYSNMREYMTGYSEAAAKDADERMYMILDCGGGTTDIACCTMNFTKSQSGKAESLGFDVHTNYAGGDTNFGGNNITYRIMQLVKIKIAQKLARDRGIPIISRLSDLIRDSSVLDSIDSGKTGIYDELDKQYETAERLIPTRFGVDSEFTRKSIYKKRIKHNFFYLWNLAERIKIEFYRLDSLVKMSGDTSITDESVSEECEKNIFDALDLNFCLYISDDKGNLVESTSRPNIEVSVIEINNLIRADLYQLMKNIIPQDIDERIAKYKHTNDEGMTGYYFFLKMTGQSCQIRLFNDLLKEFIPGKLIRNARATDHLSGRESPSIEKKLDCVRGAVMYVHDKDTGRLMPNITSDNHKLSYSVIKHGSSDIEMIGNSVKLSCHPKSAASVQLTVKNIESMDKNAVTNILIPLSNKDTGEDLENILRNDTYLRFKEEYFKDLQSQLDNIEPDKDNNILLAIPTFDCTCFILLLATKVVQEGKDIYTVIHKSVHPFDKNLSSESFFDGKR